MRPDASSVGSRDSRWKIDGATAFATRYLAITSAEYDRLTSLGTPTEHVVAAMDEALFDALAAKGYRVEDHVVSPSDSGTGRPAPAGAGTCGSCGGTG